MPPASATLRSPRLMVTGLFVLALALRLGYCIYSRSLGQSPPELYREYVLVGQRLLEHGVFDTPLLVHFVQPTPSAVLPPVYAGIVAAAYGLFGIESWSATTALQLINVLATAALVPLAYDTARRLGGRRAAWAAALLTTFDPAQVYFASFIWDTGLFALAVGAILWHTVRRAGPTARGWTCFAYGLALGALALLNPALTIAYPVLVLWLLMRGGRPPWLTLVRRIGLVIAGWCLVIAPWTIRNALVFDRLIYIRNGLGLELRLGACPEADDSVSDVYNAQYPMRNRGEEERLRRAGELAYMQRCRQLACDAIQADPGRWLGLCGQRLCDFWAGTLFSQVGPGDSPLPRARLRLAVTILYAGQTLLMLAALFLPRGRRRDAVALVVIALLFSLTYCVTHVSIRYRAPIQPVILTAAALALGRRPDTDTQPT